MAHFSPMSKALKNVSTIIKRDPRALNLRGVSVTADIVRAERQVRNLQALDAVDVKALVEHTVFDDTVTLLRGHGARAEGVPGSLDVTLLRSIDVS
jgi:hypothetical protein